MYSSEMLCALYSGFIVVRLNENIIIIIVMHYFVDYVRCAVRTQKMEHTSLKVWNKSIRFESLFSQRVKPFGKIAWCNRIHQACYKGNDNREPKVMFLKSDYPCFEWISNTSSVAKGLSFAAVRFSIHLCDTMDLNMKTKMTWPKCELNFY